MLFKRVLVLAPHTDDAELGCGGSIARMVEEGTSVFVIAFSKAEESVPEGAPKDILEQEFRRAMPRLGIPNENLYVLDYQVRRLNYRRQDVLEDLVRLRREIGPDLVLLPSGNDLHQDHQVVYAEGLRAFKDMSILGYELPWNHVSFSAQAFITLERRHVDAKWNALQAYESQLSLGRPYFAAEFLLGLASVRGTQVKSQYAEAFEVVRVKL